jgi:hypothetical protein
MSLRRRMPLLLLFLWLAIDVTLVAAAFAFCPREFFTAIFVAACIFVVIVGHASALFCWLALGNVYLRLHACVLILGALALGCCVNEPPLSTASVLIVYGIGWILPLLVLRLAGWRHEFQEEAISHGRRLQFSLREILGLTTLCGIVCGVWQLLALVPEEASPVRDVLRNIHLAMLYLLPTGLWLTIAWARPAHAVAIAAAAVTLEVRLFFASEHVGPPERFVPVVAPVSVAGFVAHALALRLARYQLRRYRTPNIRSLVKRYSASRTAVYEVVEIQ